MEAAGTALEAPLWSNPRMAARIQEVDGLRGVAILIVLAFHYLAAIGAPTHPWWTAVTATLRLFWSGVDLFFVLSGFLIAGILIDSTRSVSYFRVFYLRRIHRIFPLYYLWLAIFLIGLGMDADRFVGAGVFRGTTPLWTYVIFLQNNAPYWWNANLPTWMAMSWSLAVEEQFYLVLPTLVRVSRRALSAGAAAVIVLSPIYRGWMAARNPHLNDFSFSTFARLDGLSMGVAAALLVRYKAAWDWLGRNLAILSTGLTALFALFIVLTYWPQIPAAVDRVTSLSTLYVTALLVAVVHPATKFGAVLRTRVLQHFGRVSYGVYIFHQGIHAIVYRVVGPRAFMMPATIVSLAATLLMAEISWRLLESRLIRRAHVQYRY